MLDCRPILQDSSPQSVAGKAAWRAGRCSPAHEVGAKIMQFGHLFVWVKFNIMMEAKLNLDLTHAFQVHNSSKLVELSNDALPQISDSQVIYFFQ